MEGNQASGFWLDRPAFVTGATGLLGGWLVRRLVAARAQVVCLVRDWVPQAQLIREGLVDQVRVVRGDLQDGRLLERILGEYEIAAVFHLAAQTIVGIAGRNPVSTFETNIAGTWRLLEACRRSPSVQQIVVASSDKAYGASKTLPYREEMPLAGTAPYDVSKSCADLIARSYGQTYGMPVALTRCGNLFGGGDLNWNRIVPGTIRSVLRGQRPVIRSDGRFIRDYFYVEDGAAATMLLAERMARNPELAGQAFNFSNEDPRTVLQVVERILRWMDSPLEPEILGQAHGELREQYLCAARARTLLEWQPLFTLDEALRRTVRWYKDFLEGIRCHGHCQCAGRAARAA
jgi:CDP-glucose 4,6-dehydratase